MYSSTFKREKMWDEDRKKYQNHLHFFCWSGIEKNVYVLCDTYYIDALTQGLR